MTTLSFSSLLRTVDNNLQIYGVWTRRFIIRQETKALRTSDEAEKRQCLARASDLVFLREKAALLDLLRSKYVTKKRTRKQQLIREAAAVGMKLPIVPHEQVQKE